MDPNRPRRQSTSPWVYVGCGCAAIAFLIVAGIAGMAWWGVRKGKELEKAYSTPGGREKMVRGVLAYDKLPAGYHPGVSFSIPMVMDIAILTDQKEGISEGPDERDQFDERGFIYLSVHSWVGNEAELRRYVRGEGKRPEWFGEGDTDFQEGEILRRGSVQANGQDILYSASRGSVSREGQKSEGIVALLAIDCRGDNRARLGMWFGPDPDPSKPAGQLDLAGTPADPKAIQDFAGHFRFCPAAG